MDTTFAIAAAITVAVLIFTSIFYYDIFNPSVPFIWSNEVVLVTGGSQGLGLAFVKRLLALSTPPKHIVVLSLHEPEESFNSDRVTYIQCDVSSYKSVEAASHKVFQDVGVPTVLVNNAGILGGRKFCDMDPEVIEKVVNVNLLGPMWTTRLFLPHMMGNNHGHILNVVSLLGISGSTGVAEYCASKFGLSGFTEAMIQETKHTNVRVSAIYPGLISTALFTGVRYRFNLFPTLSPDYVAEKMVKILEAGKSAEVVVPTIANLGRAMKLIPVGVQSVVKDLIGANSSMDGFIPPSSRPNQRRK